MSGALRSPVSRFADAIEALKAAAIRRCGWNDFGDETAFLPGLSKLLAALDSDAPLTAAGRDLAFELLLTPLIARLYANEGWRRRRECLARPIKAPVIILGLPRTGTTALHRLLSLDPQFQGPELWLIDSPMPRPPRDTWDGIAQYRQCVAMMRAMNEASPMFNVIHPRGADLVDECLDITKQCFVNNVWGSYFPVNSYDAWWPSQDHHPQYRHLYRVLQLIGADDTRPWLLKDPSSILCMHLLLETFPDARLIFTHRDPMQVMSSVTSTVSAAQALTVGERLDERGIAARSADVWSRGANQLADRDIVSRAHVDVYMSALQADPMREVHRIYETLGLALSREAADAMQTPIARDRTPGVAHAPPSYRRKPEEFGIDAQRVREQFAPYIEVFGPFDC